MGDKASGFCALRAVIATVVALSSLLDVGDNPTIRLRLRAMTGTMVKARELSQRGLTSGYGSEIIGRG